MQSFTPLDPSAASQKIAPLPPSPFLERHGGSGRAGRVSHSSRRPSGPAGTADELCSCDYNLVLIRVGAGFRD